MIELSKNALSGSLLLDFWCKQTTSSNNLTNLYKYCEVNYLLRGEFFVVTMLPEYQIQTVVTTLYQFSGYNLIVTTYTE